MSDYWPSGLELSDTRSPMEILRDAQEDWQTNSSGVLALVLQEAESQSGNDMTIVHAIHVPSNRTATLFSVVHRPNRPYPATIQPKDDDLPNLLKQSYYKLGFATIGTALISAQRSTVTNKWVCDTPSEFRTKLEKVFNLGVVKSEVLNLVSSSSGVPGDNDRESTDEHGEEDQLNGVPGDNDRESTDEHGEEDQLNGEG